MHVIIKMAQIVVCSHHVTSDTSQTIHAIMSYDISNYTCIVITCTLASFPGHTPRGEGCGLGTRLHVHMS